MDQQTKKSNKRKKSRIIRIVLIVILVILVVSSSLYIWYDGLMPKTPGRVVRSSGVISFDNVSYDVGVKFVVDRGEIYAGVPYECGITIFPDVNDGQLPNVTFKMKINNAAYGDNSSSLLPDFFEVPRYGAFYQTSKTISFQSSGTGTISIIASNQTDSETYSLDQTINVEPWSSHYQIQATKLTAITNMLAVGLAIGGILVSLPLEKWMDDLE